MNGETISSRPCNRLILRGADLPVPFPAAVKIGRAVLDKFHAGAGERAVVAADDIGLARRRRGGGGRLGNRDLAHDLALDYGHIFPFDQDETPVEAALHALGRGRRREPRPAGDGRVLGAGRGGGKNQQGAHRGVHGGPAGSLHAGVSTPEATCMDIAHGLSRGRVEKFKDLSRSLVDTVRLASATLVQEYRSGE